MCASVAVRIVIRLIISKECRCQRCWLEPFAPLRSTQTIRPAPLPVKPGPPRPHPTPLSPSGKEVLLEQHLKSRCLSRLTLRASRSSTAISDVFVGISDVFVGGRTIPVASGHLFLPRCTGYAQPKPAHLRASRALARFLTLSRLRQSLSSLFLRRCAAPKAFVG